jgi:hypothetical protein
MGDSIIVSIAYFLSSYFSVIRANNSNMLVVFSFSISGILFYYGTAIMSIYIYIILLNTV